MFAPAKVRIGFFGGFVHQDYWIVDRADDLQLDHHGHAQSQVRLDHVPSAGAAGAPEAGADRPRPRALATTSASSSTTSSCRSRSAQAVGARAAIPDVERSRLLRGPGFDPQHAVLDGRPADLRRPIMAGLLEKSTR